MTYYRVSLDEELNQVNRAVNYYFDWAREFHSAKQDEFITYYYRGLDLSNLASLRFRALFFAMRLQPVLTHIKQFIQNEQRAPYILDLGCGFGLESVLICLTGAKVHGIDASKAMIEYAQKRQERYQQDHAQRLDLSYERASLFQLNSAEVYDSVYSSATLHHIEPATDAFKGISRMIKPNGYFFLSDENGYSPIQQVVVQKRIGWTRPRKLLQVDPDTGNTFVYGNENIRAPFQWARYMKQAKLRPLSIKYCRFLPPLDWPVERLIKFERRIRTIPLIAQLGAIGFLFTSQKLS